MIIMGIDPGKNGAIAKLDPKNHTLEIIRMPFHTIRPGEKIKNLVDPTGISITFNDPDIIRAFIEEQSPRPDQGVVSMFTLGRGYGILLGVAAGLDIPVSLIRPAVWKKQLKVPADKDAARFRASQLFPLCASMWQNKNEDGIAEAALIAFYGMCEMGHIVEDKFRLKEKT